MATPRQLISETLSVLGQQIIGLQCDLKILQRCKLEVLDFLIDLDERDDYLRHQIKGLKDKADWEMKEQHRLILADQPRRSPFTPQEGEEWKGASDDQTTAFDA